MLQIRVEYVAAPTLGDVRNALADPTVEGIARLLVASGKTGGVIGKALQSVLKNALPVHSEAASGALIDMIPEEVADLLVDEDGALLAQFVWLADEKGSFAAVVPGEEATIGTGAEFVEFFTRAAQHVARRVAVDPNATADARYRAARVRRPWLSVVK